MPREYGMYDIDDAWDWQPRRGHQTPDKKSGAQVQQETPAQKPIDVVPQVVKDKFIEVAVWFTQNKRPEDWTLAEASAVAKGRSFLAEKIPQHSTEIYPTAKSNLDNFTTIVAKPARVNREALLTR